MENRLDSTKIFRSERLLLRLLKNDDADHVFTLRSNEEVNKFIDRSKCTSKEQAIEFIEKVNTPGNDVLYRAIILHKEKKAVGGICLLRPEYENNICEIGYELLPQYQGQGIMQEAVKTLLNFAFTNLKFDSIAAYIHPMNIRSSTLAVKLGFIKIKNVQIKECNFDLYSCQYENAE